VSVILFWDSKNASISFNSIFSGRIVNLAGSFRGLKIAIAFKSVGKTKKKPKKKS